MLHKHNLSRPADPPQPRPLLPGPVLVARRTRYSALTLWHLLSLDAPTVATVWTGFIALCAGIPLPWSSLAAMFVAVWMIYAADRLLDARELHHRDVQLEERHRFHQRNRSRFFVGMVAAAAALAFLLPHLLASALVLYAMLASLLSVWLLAIHAQSLAGERRLPKELAVGIFFPAAVFIPTVARAPSLQPELLPIAILFAMICTLNCLYLYAWEHPTDRARAHWTTRLALWHLPQLSWATILLSMALAIISVWKLRLALAPALACGSSTALLLLLHHRRAHVPKLQLRALADVVLLTPLLAWLVR